MGSSINSSPAAPPSLKKSTSSSKNQTSIAGFFKKKDPALSTNDTPRINGAALPIKSLSKTNGLKNSSGSSNQSLTPAPSSDGVDELRDEEVARPAYSKGNIGPNGLPSPITPANFIDASDPGQENLVPRGFYSPSRKVGFSP